MLASRQAELDKLVPRLVGGMVSVGVPNSARGALFSFNIILGIDPKTAFYDFGFGPAHQPAAA